VDRLLKFDHDFIGRAALEKMASGPRRTRVTLVWRKEDVSRIHDSLLEAGIPYKYMEMPVLYYAFHQRDEVRDLNGKLIGTAAFSGYSSNETEVLSLAMLDTEHAAPGTEVVLTWGEPNGGSRKPNVERHRQVKVRATVGPAPYASAVRQLKRETLAKGQQVA
jgi:vanillate/3-O-methylgallate O-demethylase